MLAAGFYIPRDADPLVCEAMRSILGQAAERARAAERQAQADQLAAELKRRMG